MVTFGKLGRYGRLGNQMFQVASTIGIARRLGYQVGFPKWENYDAKERFGSAEDISVGDWFPAFKNYPTIDPEPFYEYFIPWGFHGFGIPDGVSLVGHMQSELYFEHCADEIRELFVMENQVRHDYTAVHIRLGDYGGDYHPICHSSYYREAIKAIEGPYMVFSDDRWKASDILDSVLPRETIYHAGDTRDAFVQMKGCKSHIIANSTFSWWAAWLANGEVVAPKQWFGPKASQLETKDIYPKQWIVI